MIVYLRLAFGTLCVLAPGWAVARALGQRSVSAVLAWTMASVFVAWAAVFTLHRSIHLAVAVANAPDGTTVRTVWTAVDVPSQNIKDQKLGETTFATKDVGSNVHFTLAGPGDQAWPAGSYKVDIYLDDKLDRTLTYTVQ